MHGESRNHFGAETMNYSVTEITDQPCINTSPKWPCLCLPTPPEGHEERLRAPSRRKEELPEPGTLAEGTGHRGIAAPAPWHQHTPPAHGKALWGQAYVDRTGTLMLKTGSLNLNIHQEE